jgi:hypothetical protein
MAEVKINAQPGFYLAYKHGRLIAHPQCFATEAAAQKMLDEFDPEVAADLHIVQVPEDGDRRDTPDRRSPRPRRRMDVTVEWALKAALGGLWSLVLLIGGAYLDTKFDVAKNSISRQEVNEDLQTMRDSFSGQVKDLREYMDRSNQQVFERLEGLKQGQERIAKQHPPEVVRRIFVYPKGRP